MSPTVYSFPTTSDLSNGLNSFVEKVSREAIEDHGSLSVAISGGSLPKLLSKELIHNKQVDFSKWHIFWADERCVGYDSDDSNYKEVKKTLLDHVPIPANHIYRIHETYGINKQTELAAKDYQEQLVSYFGKDGFPRFDLILLGMGPDGHCCSLFPGHPLLQERTLWVAPIDDSPKPPPERITLTLPVVNHAQTVVFVTAGEGKREMVQKIIEQPQLELPCQRVQPENGQVYWFVDEPAAGSLNKSSYASYKL
ncbi:6-phosphogluconolactonase [Halteromyces radiatus]|uniref:6-phosphogluconolactonase n=1 Tax=Halteromyces radiatus TaxID=101107 RepID=UPI00221FE7E1|nr:6-phosphogluconolactonase [Halteromyces radiatus]KAI8098632.1 6-phosphogluconolactonase [Halteromyces radiatus]